MPVPDLVLPGHPRMDPDPQSPRLSEKHWQALLDHGIAEMERLLARYVKDGEGFLDGSAKTLLPGLEYLGDLDQRPIFCLRTPKGMYLVDVPGGPAMVEILARVVQRGQGPRPTAVLLTSADEQATAGLKALVEYCGCEVVTARAGVEAVRRKCPAGTRIVVAEDTEKTGWFTTRELPARVIPLAGRGLAPLAYEVRLGGQDPPFLGSDTGEVDGFVGGAIAAQLSRLPPRGSNTFNRSTAWQESSPICG